MTPQKRFLIGGGGALMPVLVSFLAIDIGAALSNDANLSTANVIGIAIRYVILFIVGGVVAYLHDDENKPFKLFELGIAAPALITSLITAQGVVANPSNTSGNQTASINISFIGAAYASEPEASEEIVLAGGFLSDIFRGIDGRVYRDVGKSLDKDHAEIGKPIDKAVVDIGKTVEKAAQDTGNAIEKAASDTEKSTEKTSGNTDEKNDQELIKARAEAAKLQAEAARAKAEALAKEYQAALAKAEAAEAEAHAAAQQVLLLEKSTQ